MTTDDKGGNLSIPPQIPKAVEIAIRRELRPLIDELTAVISESKKVLEELKNNDTLTNMQYREELKRCKQKLQYAESKIADLESSVRVWRKNSELHEANNTNLQDELAKVKYEIGALRSIIENNERPTA